MENIIPRFGFVSETQIPLLDGRDLSISALLQEFGTSQPFWVYSCDPLGNIYPRLAKLNSEIATPSPVLKITLDSGDSFICSEDQLLVRRDGTHAKAKDVRVLDSLMPLYRKIDDKSLKGYEMVLSQRTHKWNYTHRLSASKDGRYNKSVVHHVNFNKRDNRPDNLQVMSWEEHTKLHMEQCELLNEYAVSPEGRAKSREVMLRNWSDEEWKKKQIELNRANRKAGNKRMVSEGRMGFQAMDKEAHSQMARENAIRRETHLQLHTPEAAKKRTEKRRKRMETDEEFAKQSADRARKNLEAYNQRIASGEVELNEKQRAARRENIKKAQEARLQNKKEKESNKFQQHLPFFEDEPNNHKVVCVEYTGSRDVYMLTAEGDHSFALLAGVFVK